MTIDTAITFCFGNHGARLSAQLAPGTGWLVPARFPFVDLADGEADVAFQRRTVPVWIFNPAIACRHAPTTLPICCARGPARRSATSSCDGVVYRRLSSRAFGGAEYRPPAARRQLAPRGPQSRCRRCRLPALVARTAGRDADRAALRGSGRSRRRIAEHHCRALRFAMGVEPRFGTERALQRTMSSCGAAYARRRWCCARGADGIPRHRQRPFPHRPPPASLRSAASSTAVEWIFSFPDGFPSHQRCRSVHRYGTHVLAKTIWSEVASVTGAGRTAAVAIVRERRATFAASRRRTPTASARRSGAISSGGLDKYRSAATSKADPFGNRARTDAPTVANSVCRTRSRPPYRSREPVLLGPA